MDIFTIGYHFPKCHKFKVEIMNVFEIKNLKCSYKNRGENNSRFVLEIKELDLVAGEVVFIIGPSGIGKSTILETLGLMNDTIHNPHDENVKFKYLFIDKKFGDEKSIGIIDLWKQKDKERSKFRKEHFSFIFQQTNLMHNFTAFENVMVTSLLKGESKIQCYEKALQLLSTIGLPVLGLDRMATELAGGQQQRLAFARAILPDFNVLFCDEPTGNLDVINAENLMGILRDQIKSKLNTTAIIVSHDLKLASRFADTIVLIRPEPGKDDSGDYIFGCIDETSLFKSKKPHKDRIWEKSKNAFCNECDMEDYLKGIISGSSPKINISKNNPKIES